MPVKKTTRSKAPAPSKKSSSTTTVSTKTVKSSKRSPGAGAMLVVAMCVTGAVIVIAAREMKPAARMPVSDARVDTELATVASKTTSPSASTTPLPAPATLTDSAEPKTTAANTAPVTIFGCLERSNDAYRLTETVGADAPKSRSWKTGFLKKGSANVEIVDPGNRARLSTQVGHRIGVTGTFTEKQLQVRSVRRVSGSCGN